jgi:tRNA-dihydrouridine synthase B
MQIGPYRLDSPLILAPMAGITDSPFRKLCRRYGAAMAVSEMISANPALREDRKTLLRTDHSSESGIRAVQILGNDPSEMAAAARINADRGAQIIDINMGCPAKKVCKKAAGSALMRDEELVADILESVVRSVEVPVTLKIRTGWDTENRNAVNIARLAEQSGIQALTVHGRTRACGFSGEAEYLTIAAVKDAVSIPVTANGDIDSAAKALRVLTETGADAVMVGRAALGQPWIFQSLRNATTGKDQPHEPGFAEIRGVILEHLRELHGFYGEHQGLRVSRKHIGWYFDRLPGFERFKPIFNSQSRLDGQRAVIEQAFDQTPTCRTT